MKKYLFSALALPLLFACSTDDFEKPMASNDPYPGIEKVNATFYMDEEPITRMDNGTGWTLAPGDLYGFAWMGDGEILNDGDFDGNAYQNHNLIQKDGRFEPQTSIYVGKYYIYRPYDYTTVSPQAINFNSLIEQPMAEGYESSKDAWKKLAEKAIIIADKWTDINPEGRTYPNPDDVNVFEDGGDWDKPGIAKPYKVFAAFFSNQTGLDLKYTNNNPTFANEKNVKGATDIDYNIGAGESAGAADIYGATVQLTGAANSFTYAPTESPNGDQHDGEYWANKTKDDVEGFTFAEAAPITLTAPAGSPIGTGDEGSTGWFWFNSLPVTGGDAATVNTTVATTIKTSYGTVTIDKNSQNNDLTIGDCAWAFEVPTGGTVKEWMKLVDQNAEDLNVNPKKWGIEHNTFVNQFGNHKGKYKFDVDFSTAVMDIHIVDDNHLQKYLKFYMASGKNQGANLVLDGDANEEFKLSKISIALLQTINATAQNKVLVAPCKLEDHNAPANGRVKIVVTQDGQTGDLADKKEVPALYDVFADNAIFENDEEEVPAVPVYLSKDCEWTWADEIKTSVDGVDVPGMLKIDENVASITNEGTLNVTNTNVQLSIEDVPLFNSAAGVGRPAAVMNFTAVTTVKNPLTNWGVINVNAGAELRAYGVAITNDATSLTAYGIINNSGVVGVTYNSGDGAEFNNYGLIDMKSQTAMTLLTRNQTPGDETSFKNAFNPENNKLGTVILPDNNPIAIVSVSNAPETGFIKYNLPEDMTTYETPAGNVKFNTIVVNGDITFTDVENEIQYIEFTGTRIKVVNPDADNLPQLRGIIVTNNSSILIEKTNEIVCSESAYVGTGATIYNGGQFTPNATVNGTTATNYLGEWSTDQVVVYGN